MYPRECIVCYSAKTCFVSRFVCPHVVCDECSVVMDRVACLVCSTTRVRRPVSTAVTIFEKGSCRETTTSIKGVTFCGNDALPDSNYCVLHCGTPPDLPSRSRVHEDLTRHCLKLHEMRMKSTVAVAEEFTEDLTQDVTQIILQNHRTLVLLLQHQAGGTNGVRDAGDRLDAAHRHMDRLVCTERWVWGAVSSCIVLMWLMGAM